MVAGTAITGAMTVAQWVLNAAMSANPIGLVIAIIVALVAAIVLAYKNSETFETSSKRHGTVSRWRHRSPGTTS